MNVLHSATISSYLWVEDLLVISLLCEESRFLRVVTLIQRCLYRVYKTWTNNIMNSGKILKKNVCLELPPGGL